MNTQKAERVLRSIRKALSSGKFVMHGSVRRSNTLLPNRPRITSRRRHNLHQKLVYATKSVLVATMYANYPCVNWRHKLRKEELWIKYEGKGNTVTFRYGFIHLALRSTFAGNHIICASEKAVNVVRTFKVDPEVFEALWQKRKIKIFPKYPGRH